MNLEDMRIAYEQVKSNTGISLMPYLKDDIRPTDYVQPEYQTFPYMSLPEIGDAVEHLPRQIGHFEFWDNGHTFRAIDFQHWKCTYCGLELTLQTSAPCGTYASVEAFAARELVLKKERLK